MFEEIGSIKVMYSLADILNDKNARRLINIIVLKFPSKANLFVLMKNIFTIIFLDFPEEKHDIVL